MKKTIITTGIFICLLIGAYVGYNVFLQHKADNKFICDCKDSKNTAGVLLFDLYHDASAVKNMKIKLNRDSIPLDSSKIRGDQKPFTYEYDRRFNVNDTITISVADKEYVISGFKNDVVIINDKKGMECKLKSAEINGVTQTGNRYKLQ